MMRAPLYINTLIDRVLAELETARDVYRFISANTVKKTNSCGKQIDKTIDRSHLWLAQTPQGFIILFCYKHFNSLKIPTRLQMSLFI